MWVYFQKSVHNLDLLYQNIPNGFIQWETRVNKRKKSVTHLTCIYKIRLYTIKKFT